MNKLVNNEYYFKTEEGYISNRLNRETGMYDVVIPTPGDYHLDHLRRHNDLLMFNAKERILGAFAQGILSKDVTIIKVTTTITRETVESVVTTLNKGEF